MKKSLFYELLSIADEMAESINNISDDYYRDDDVINKYLEFKKKYLPIHIDNK